MEQFNIRHLTNDDYDKYKILINEFRETEFNPIQFENTLDYINHYSEIWIIEYKSDIVATGTILYERKFIYNNSVLGHIEDICVKKEYRGLGLGKKIVSHLMTRAKEKGVYKITLVCNENNIGFYKKCNLEQRGVQMSQIAINITST